MFSQNITKNIVTPLPFATLKLSQIMFFITIVWLIIKKIKKTFRAFVKNLKNYLDLLNFF